MFPSLFYAEALKKRKKKRKKTRFCLSLILHFPRHTETFLYT